MPCPNPYIVLGILQPVLSYIIVIIIIIIIIVIVYNAMPKPGYNSDILKSGLSSIIIIIIVYNDMPKPRYSCRST